MNIGANRQLAGEYGGRYIDATSGTVTGNFMELHANQAAILGAVTSNITGLPLGFTMAAGDSINGVFTSVVVSAGSVVAYNRKYV